MRTYYLKVSRIVSEVNKPVAQRGAMCAPFCVRGCREHLLVQDGRPWHYVTTLQRIMPEWATHTVVVGPYVPSGSKVQQAKHLYKIFSPLFSVVSSPILILFLLLIIIILYFSQFIPAHTQYVIWLALFLSLSATLYLDALVRCLPSSSILMPGHCSPLLVVTG